MARSNKFWITAQIQPFNQGAGTYGQYVLSTSAALGTTLDDEFTIMRTIGYIRVQSPTGATGSTTGAVGIIVSDAPITGATATLDPVADGDADWLWWQPVSLSSGSGESGSGRSLLHFPIDTKSRRICGRKEQLTLNVGNNGSSGMTVMGGFRILLLMG